MNDLRHLLYFYLNLGSFYQLYFTNKTKIVMGV